MVSQAFQTRDLAFLIFVLYLVLRVLSAAERDCSQLSRQHLCFMKWILISSLLVVTSQWKNSLIRLALQLQKCLYSSPL